MGCGAFIFHLRRINIRDRFRINNLSIYWSCSDQYPFNWNGLEDREEAKDKLIGVICCLIAAISGAVAFVCMRFMKTDIHFAVSPFWYALACTFFSPIGASAIDLKENE